MNNTSSHSSANAIYIATTAESRSDQITHAKAAHTSMSRSLRASACSVASLCRSKVAVYCCRLRSYCPLARWMAVRAAMRPL